MDPLSLLSGVGSVLGGIGGLFGSKKKKDPTPRQNLLSQARGAREAADKYGFNPLTMLQYGQPGGAMGGGGGSAPPLASIQAITDGLRDINDITSGAAERRRKAEELELDLAQIRLDQARSGVVAVGPGANSVGTGPSPLGRRAVQVPNGGAVHAAPRPSLATASAAVSGGSLAARPAQHPRTRNNEMIPVTWTDGKPSAIPRGVADRLDLKPFDSIVAGDLEELRGEWVGGVENSVRAPDVVRYQANGTPLGVTVEPHVLEVEGDNTSDVYNKIFGPDHPATKKAKSKKPKKEETR